MTVIWLRCVDNVREWSTQEVRILKAYAALGSRGVAALLERTPRQVEWAAVVHGVSLRTSDDDVQISASILDTIERVRETPDLSICPMCGKRFARMKATGMCRCCHLDGLLTLHQERLDEEIRLRKLDKARQDKRRMRVCDRCGQPFFPRPTSTDSVCGDCS